MAAATTVAITVIAMVAIIHDRPRQVAGMIVRATVIIVRRAAGRAATMSDRRAVGRAAIASRRRVVGTAVVVVRRRRVAGKPAIVRRVRRRHPVRTHLPVGTSIAVVEIAIAATDAAVMTHNV
jgi:hypothetical protein